jgi:AraC-like DNA-binding protein
MKSSIDESGTDLTGILGIEASMEQHLENSGYLENVGYYPLQIPYILHKPFSEAIRYTEKTDASSSAFVICFWEMRPKTEKELSVSNVIVTDGCIDLVVDYDARQIGFAGMSRTEFDYRIQLPTRCFGARMKPGAFHQLFSLPAAAAMDAFLSIDEVDRDFDCPAFFSLSFEKAGRFFRAYFAEKSVGIVPNQFVRLFDELSGAIPDSAAELYRRMGYGPRQCQRLFSQNFGLSPQMTLSILRFQRCLKALTSGRARPSDILSVSSYYDQSHYIKDFKRNIGLTPSELLRRYDT